MTTEIKIEHKKPYLFHGHLTSNGMTNFLPQLCVRYDVRMQRPK